MFGKILIANRGEVAVRIIRACREMGISTVAVFSEADAEELHTALADEKICIGPARADQSYLQEERIISAALSTGANAIHPGYGFLSESAHFAALCEKNGIAFIGPDAGTMEALSDKALTKEKMAAAPCAFPSASQDRFEIGAEDHPRRIPEKPALGDF